MDRNVLTEQRRENVIGLLKSMNIKKSTTDGFDIDSVYECMQELCDLYEKNIEDLENAYEGELEELKDKYQKYDDNNDLYVSLIMEAKKSSNEIINQAKSEVESILNEGKAQVAKQEQELEQMHVEMNAQRQAMTNELKAAREAADAEKAAMKAEVEAEKQKSMALKNKYTQQLNAMEEEFAEIKTNILRTAGKMDSLKSKFPDDEEVNWNVINDVEGVDFPVTQMGVEENIITNIPAEENIFTESEPEVATYPTREIQREQDTPAVQEAVFEQENTTPADHIRFETKATTPDDHITFETAAPSVPAQDAVPEMNFDDIEIDLPDFKEEPASEAPDEISFEGLEELFKDDK